MHFVVVLFLVPLFSALLIGGAYVVMIFQSLPDVDDLGKDLAESTVILDKEGNELYRLYNEENREYVTLENVSDNFKHAILAIEDKRFYTHPGIDIAGLLRALGSNVKGGSLQGASTITQQLVKNSILKTNERSIDRKLKEAILAYQVEQKFTKDKILELYVNQIPFGGNAHGIQMASKHFFSKEAKDLSIAESAVLASLPKGPTYYSPFGQNKHLLIGYCKNSSGEAVEAEAPKMKPSQDFTITVLATGRVWLRLTADGVSEGKVERTMEAGEQVELTAKEEFQFSVGNKSFELYIGETQINIPADRQFTISKADVADLVTSDEPEVINPEAVFGVEGCDSMYDNNYVKGRKDHVLLRMLDDEYITEEELAAAWTESHQIDFTKPREKITYPHFVMYVRQYLEDKYGEGVASKGYVVKTTIDPTVQDIAEKVVADQGDINDRRKGVKNAALVSVDPNNGHILAMVGSRDYFDTENDGNVNVTTRRRQPGSSFKPFMFAALFEGNFGAGSVFWDVQTKFGGKSPNNYDGEFMGPMTARQALAYSRNIPPIKAFFLADGEEKFLDFLSKVGLGYLRTTKETINADRAEEEHFHYGWPLSIGTGEVRPLDMASAYAVFANGGFYHEPVSILQVTTSEGEIIEEWEAPVVAEGDEAPEPLIDPQVTYQITDILSDVDARPGMTMWRRNLSVPGHPSAGKTGTSNKRFGSTILPSDLWTVGYTKHMATAVWAGNNDGSALNYQATGLTEASPMFYDFMRQAHEGKEPLEFERPDGLVNVSMSLLSGTKATEKTPQEYVRSGLFSSWSVPAGYDEGHGKAKIDKRNGLLATDECPPEVVEEVIILNVSSERPSWSNWENPVQAWAKKQGFESGEEKEIPTEESPLCRETAEDERLSLSVTTPSNNGTLPPGRASVYVDIDAPIGLSKVEYYLDGELQYTASSKPFNVGYVNVPNDDKLHLVRVVAFDTNYYNEVAFAKVSVAQDTTPPTVTITSPSSGSSIELGESMTISVTAVDQESDVSGVDIYVDGELVKAFEEPPFVFTLYLNEDFYTTGSHTVKAFARDLKGNAATASASFTITD